MNIVIMAGGGGTRLWPLSREGKPKQFLDLGTGKTLVEHAYDRARALVEPGHIFVATSALYEQDVKTCLPGVASEQIFLEPKRRDTTAAFISVALRLAAMGKGNEPALFLWSDHVFTNEKEFIEDLKKIPKILSKHPKSLVLVAHTPVSPETAFGYIEMGGSIKGYDDVFQVKEFKEKPDQKTAEAFVDAGNYFWNIGYFSILPDYLLREVCRCTPTLTKHVEKLKEALDKKDEKEADRVYSKFPKVSIEYTLLEKTKDIIAVTGDYGWSDVGNWSVVKELFGVNGDHVAAGHHIHVDSQSNYVYNATNKAVCLIGLEDVIVVVTKDAVLVTRKDMSQRVKDAVQKLETDGKKKYL